MMGNVFLRILGGILASVLLAICLASCGPSGFDPVGTLEYRPVRLDGEQVLLDQGQLECGTREELWNLSPLGEGRGIARLTKKARDLQFSDDVQIGDPAVGSPYAQIHGTFPIRVLRMGSVHDEDQFTKTVEAKISVSIENACFQSTPVILMGIRHGQFDPSANPVFRLKLDQTWSVDQVVH